MSAIWYVTGRWPYTEVQEVEVVKETGSCVWTVVNGYTHTQRHSKRSSYENFFRTEDEAIAYIKQGFDANYEAALQSLERAERNRSAKITVRRISSSQEANHAEV